MYSSCQNIGKHLPGKWHCFSPLSKNLDTYNYIAPFLLSAATLCLASDLVLENGEIDIPSPITIGSEARFECTGDGALKGATSRVCQAAGWSGMNPVCSEYIS